MASSFLPEKLAGRAAFSLEVCEDITGGTVGARGAGPVVGMGFTMGTGSGEVSSAGDEGGMGWGFLSQWGRVAEVRTFSMGLLFSS